MSIESDIEFARALIRIAAAANSGTEVAQEVAVMLSRVRADIRQDERRVIVDILKAEGFGDAALLVNSISDPKSKNGEG